MSKLHYCDNGVPVTKQVISYQKTRSSDDFVPLLKYYSNFKDVWFSQIEDYMDRSSFDSEFDYRLFKAAESFDSNTAEENSSSKGLNSLGDFNRWFYKILMNWKSNVKTSSYRLKKRSPVMCPICGRQVGRIDQEHLNHYKTTSDLPEYVVWQGNIYEVCISPRAYAITWGEKTQSKLSNLMSGKTKEYLSEKKRVKWPWRLKDGKRGVLCPFTKKVITKIDDEYIKNLSDSYNHYAPVVEWHDFVRLYPSALIQSEMFSIEQSVDADSKKSIKYNIHKNRVDNTGSFCVPENETIDINNIDVSPEFEHSFKSIEKCVNNKIDENILKLIAIGYSIDDICETISLDKKEIKTRIKKIRSHANLEQMLINV